MLVRNMRDLEELAIDLTDHVSELDNYSHDVVSKFYSELTFALFSYKPEGLAMPSDWSDYLTSDATKKLVSDYVNNFIVAQALK